MALAVHCAVCTCACGSFNGPADLSGPALWSALGKSPQRSIKLKHTACEKKGRLLPQPCVYLSKYGHTPPGCRRGEAQRPNEGTLQNNIWGGVCLWVCACVFTLGALCARAPVWFPDCGRRHWCVCVSPGPWSSIQRRLCKLQNKSAQPKPVGHVSLRCSGSQVYFVTFAVWKCGIHRAKGRVSLLISGFDWDQEFNWGLNRPQRRYFVTSAVQFATCLSSVHVEAMLTHCCWLFGPKQEFSATTNIYWQEVAPNISIWDFPSYGHMS